MVRQQNILAQIHCMYISQYVMLLLCVFLFSISCSTGLSCEQGVAQALAGRWLVPFNYSNFTTFEQFLSSPPDVNSIRPYTIPCPNNNCLNGGICGVNRKNPASTNVMCAQCEDLHTEIGHTCVYCPGVNVGLLILLIIVLFLFVLLLHRMSRTNAGGESSLFFYYVQIVLFETGSIAPWLQWLSIFQFSPASTTGSTCVAPLDSYQKMALDIFTPFILCGILFILIAVHYFLHSRVSFSLFTQFLCCRKLNHYFFADARSQPHNNVDPSNKHNGLNNESNSSIIPIADSTKDPQPGLFASSLPSSSESSSFSSSSSLNPTTWYPFTIDPYIRTFISIFLFSYQNVASTILNKWVCQSTGVSSPSSVVYSSPSMDCNSDEYRSWLAILILFFIFFVVAGPVVLFIWLWVHRAAIKNRYNIENFDHTLLSRRFGIIFEGFKPKAYWWTIVILMRRFIFIVLATAFIYHPDERYATFTIWNALTLILHVSYRPYTSTYCNNMESFTLLSLIIISVLLQLNHANSNVNDPSGGEVIVSGDTQSSYSYATYLQVLLTFLFLIPCCIMIGHFIYRIFRPTIILWTNKLSSKQDKSISSPVDESSMHSSDALSPAANADQSAMNHSCSLNQQSDKCTQQFSVKADDVLGAPRSASVSTRLSRPSSLQPARSRHTVAGTELTSTIVENVEEIEMLHRNSQQL